MRTTSNTPYIANGEESGPLPVVELPENGAMLHSLLTLIFPVIPILPSTPEKIMELLAVAQKYQMDSVLNHIRSIVGARISKITRRLFGPFAPAGRGKRAGSREGVAPSRRHGLDLPKRCQKGLALLRLCGKGPHPSEALLEGSTPF